MFTDVWTEKVPKKSKKKARKEWFISTELHQIYQ